MHIFWNAGALKVADPFSFLTGTHNYADILTVMSTTGGMSWGSPVRVNSNVEPMPNGRGTDQYQPAPAADSTGTIAVCYYSREFDPKNIKFERVCGTSTNGGTSWTNTRITTVSSSPVHDVDVGVSHTCMGDYDTLATDAIGANTGFIGTFQTDNSSGDASVQAMKF